MAPTGNVELSLASAPSLHPSRTITPARPVPDPCLIKHAAIAGAGNPADQRASSDDDNLPVKGSLTAAAFMAMFSVSSWE